MAVSTAHDASPFAMALAHGTDRGAMTAADLGGMGLYMDGGIPGGRRPVADNVDSIRLRQDIAEAWAAIPDTHLTELIRRMKEKCVAVIAAQGKPDDGSTVPGGPEAGTATC